MFCSECGNQLAEGVKFCPECGAKLPIREVAPEPVRETEPIKEVEPVKMAEPEKEVVPEPIVPVQMPVEPMQRPVTPMVTQQNPSGLVRRKVGINASYFKNPGYLMIFIGNLLAFIGCFLPFAHNAFESRSLVEFDGGGAIIVAATVCVVFTFVKPRVVFIPDIVLVSLYGLTFLLLLAEELLKALSVGAFIILLASVAGLVGAIMFRKDFNSSVE